MLQLNDDCLLHIFRLLNTREQLMLTRTCMRFRDVIVDLLWRSEFREFSNKSIETNTLDDDEHEEFFALNSVNLEKLTVIDLELPFKFSSYFFNSESYFKFEFPNLVELECRDLLLDDGHVYLIAKNCANLRVLLISNSHVTGAYVKDLRQLRQLYVPDSTLRSEHLEAILRELPLTHLDVAGSSIYCDLGKVLSNLTGTNLRVLRISEKAIDERFIENYHKLNGLRKLQVFEDPHVMNTHWPRLLKAMGARTKALYIKNTISNTSAANMIATNLSLLSKLQKIYFTPQSDIENENAFWQLTTLKELHLCSENYLMASLPLVSNCAGLEDIYLERRIGLRHDGVEFEDEFDWLARLIHQHEGVMHQDIFDWADRLIQLLQSQTTPRPVLNVHITECKPEKLAQKLIKELDALDPQQSVVKWVCEEPMLFSTPLWYWERDAPFVRFEFE